MPSTRAALLLVLASTACVPTAVVRDRESACRVARSMLREQMSAADLIEVSAPFPAVNVQARRAYHARMAALVLSGIGAAGLVGGFVTGFATDITDPRTRIGFYSLVGTTIGLGAGALLSGMLATRARSRAYAELDAATRAECP